ncbi:uncharacterized protein J3R85_017572 [Psidium guajava]|nr:uncharacterized protein J3R85_017572 [Psidium guajava]
MAAGGVRSFGSFAVAFAAAILLTAVASSAQEPAMAPAPAHMESGAAFVPASFAVIGSSVALSLLALLKH